MTDKIGVGVLSSAHGHVVRYAQLIKSTYDDAEVVAYWDDNLERGAKFAADNGIALSETVDAVVNHPDVDLVIVASETNKHADLACAAMEAGKAVVVQKPMATSLADCDRIIETAKRTGAFFSMAWQMRCDPQNMRMKEMVDSGAVGKVGWIRRRHCLNLFFNEAFMTGLSRWHIDKESNIGIVFDDISHAFDWVLWMRDEEMPVSIMAEIGQALTDYGTEDTGTTILRWADGMFATITHSSVVWASENTTEIYGDKGAIIQNHGDGPSCALKPPCPIAVKLFQPEKKELGWQDQGMEIPDSHGERIGGVTERILEAYKTGVPICSAENGRKSIEMMLAAYESSKTGRRITFPFKG